MKTAADGGSINEISTTQSTAEPALDVRDT